MNEQLIIVHVAQEVIDSVTVVNRKNLERDNEFLDRAIEKAESIIRKASSTGFDEEVDSCGIFCVDPRTGETHEVWAHGAQNERA